MWDEKELLKAHLETGDIRPGEKVVGDKGQTRSTSSANERSSQAWRIKEAEENRMIAYIDNKDVFKKILPILERLDAGKMDVTTAINKASKLAFAEGIKMMFMSQSDKVRADLAKHFLALAGHTPTQKIELGRVDPSTPREALLAQLAGAKKDLEQAGVEVIDDRTKEPDKTE